MATNEMQWYVRSRRNVHRLNGQDCNSNDRLRSLMLLVALMGYLLVHYYQAVVLLISDAQLLTIYFYVGFI